MPDKPNTPFTLAGHRLVALRGPDAVRFAHAQFMSDVAALADGHWHWSGWLTPKGRVVALFALLRLDAGRVWLVLPDADPDDLAAQLRRFVFRSKVALDVRPDLQVGGAFAAPLQARGNVLAGSEGAGFELDMAGAGGARVLRVGTAAHAKPDDALIARWRVADLAHGLPRLEASQADRWTPQQLSLERLHAFSVKKGCYPGQEIVARTHFLGKVKRGLVLLADDAPFDVGVDDVVSVATDGTQHFALAVRPMEREPDPRERPILDGLAR
ncbi:MAG TPA: folate-binding protein [Xanthomonadaceae bacterium]|nr:folate-binding protein [Xanthomonadaceae bacterium]